MVSDNSHLCLSPLSGRRGDPERAWKGGGKLNPVKEEMADGDRAH